MFRVERHEGTIATVNLGDVSADSEAVLAPARGGMVTGLRLGGREILYLDRPTFEDLSANVRGGIPVLFPSPGKLAGDTWARDGERGAMRQHGFARNLGWEIAAVGEGDGAFATLALSSSDVTRAQYPWDFRAEYTYRIKGRALGIEMSIVNLGARTMPFGAGFHPYFAVPDAAKAAARIPTHATRAFDNKAKREIPFAGLDLTAEEVDLHLHDHGSSEASLLFGGVEIALRGSPELGRWVIWTLRGRDFVCLEPWTCPGNALNTGEGLIALPPGEARRLWLEIELR